MVEREASPKWLPFRLAKRKESDSRVLDRREGTETELPSCLSYFRKIIRGETYGFILHNEDYGVKLSRPGRIIDNFLFGGDNASSLSKNDFLK